MVSESQEEYEPKNVRSDRFCKRLAKKYKLHKPKPKIEYNECKIEEEEMISEIIKENVNPENQTKRERFMSHVERNIMKKLGITE